MGKTFGPSVKLFRPDATVREVITVVLPPRELIHSQWGRIRWEDWCRKEAKRMNEQGALVEPVTLDDGQMCIAKL